MAATSRPLPADAALSPRWHLTDPASVAELLAPSLGELTLGAGEVRYLEHDPGRSWLVQLRYPTPTGQQQVVVSVGRLKPIAGQPDSPALALGHRMIGTRDGVMYSWFPADPGLPLLSGTLGLDPGARVLSWVPQQRAVLATGGQVLKICADPATIDAGVASLTALASRVRVPRVLGRPGPHAFLQEHLSGRALGRDDALACAQPAGAMARQVHGLPADSLPTWTRLPATDYHQLWAGPVALACHAAPDLTERLDAADHALRASAPALSLRPAHGDFGIGQLIDLGSQLGLVDTDTLCLAPPALDLAAYATNVISGRSGDLDDARRIRDAVVSGYGERPAGLDWAMAATALRRIDRSVRRGKKHWHERVSQTLDDVESLTRELF